MDPKMNTLVEIAAISEEKFKISQDKLMADQSVPTGS